MKWHSILRKVFLVRIAFVGTVLFTGCVTSCGSLTTRTAVYNYRPFLI